MDGLRVLIVDDEPLARGRLRRLLEREGVRDVEECRTGEQAAAALEADPFDLVLLDVQMPGMDGFGVVEAVGVERMPVTVFVTAYDEHALRAFEAHALDYLVKPVDEDRFARTLERVRERVRLGAAREQDAVLSAVLERLSHGEGAAAPSAAAPVYVERMMVTLGGQTRFLRTDEIDWIEAEGNYARLHVGARSCLIRETMGALEKKLDPRHFLRAHRSAIVNLERVVEMHPAFGGNYLLKLSTGAEVPLSRGYRHRMKDRIATYT